MSPFVGGFQKVPSCMYTRLHEYDTARKQETNETKYHVSWKLLSQLPRQRTRILATPKDQPHLTMRQ